MTERWNGPAATIASRSSLFRAEALAKVWIIDLQTSATLVRLTVERTLTEWPYSGPLDTDADRSLKKSNRNDQVATALDVLQYPFYVAKRPVFDDYALPHLEEWPGLHEEPGLHNGLEGSDFAFINGLWSGAHPNHMYYARRSQDRQPVLRVEAAKNIAGEQRKVHLLYAVRPAPATGVQWQEFVESLVAEETRHGLFAAGSDAQRIPGILKIHTRLRQFLGSMIN